MNLTKSAESPLIEQYGMSEECLKLKAQGMGAPRMAKALSTICGEEITPNNVEHFFRNLRRLSTKDKAMMLKVQQEVNIKRLKILGNWDIIDDEFKTLLDQAKQVQTRIVNTKGGTRSIETRDLKLIDNVLNSIVRVTETRLRLLGQMSGDFHVHFTNVEHQYTNLKQIVISAEDAFPGIGEWIETQMVDKGKPD